MATNDLNICEETLVERCDVPQVTQSTSNPPAAAQRLVRQGLGRALGSLAVIPIGLVASGIVPTAPFAPSVHQSTPMRGLLPRVHAPDSNKAPLSATVTSSTAQTSAVGTSQGVLGPVTGFGTASGKEYGQPSSLMAAPIVAIVRTPDGGGYWLVGADGGVFAFGDATFYGSLANTHLARPIVAAIPTPGGGGYWLASAVMDAVETSPARTVPTSSSTTGTTTGTPLGSFVVTCYDLNGRTASGAFTSMATVAVDPSVIALGTKIYIQGVGYRYAQDTGGAIKGRRLDIWEPTYSDCMSWGVRSASVWAP